MSRFLTSRSQSLLLAAGLVLAAGALPASAQKRIAFVSPEAALEQGLNAYRAGFDEIALPALTFAAENKLFLGRYHLGRLFSEERSNLTNHARAYEIFQDIVNEHAPHIDVDDDERAPYVGKALTFLGRYVYRGVPEAGISASPARAAEFLQEAATFFREPDAQYELAKLYLTGDGVEKDTRRAVHWFSALSQQGHVSAQATFADILWTGKVVSKDEKRALALITLAMENTPVNERFWIEDIYQRIFCGSSPSVRQQADGLVASFRQQFMPRQMMDPAERSIGDASPERVCSNGEKIEVPKRERQAQSQRRTQLPGADQRDIMDVRSKR